VIRTIAYWISTVLLAAGYVMGGYMDLAQPAEFMDQAKHLGYPPFFFTILGVWKLGGAVVILAPGLPRLKEWAYAGFVINLTGAIAVHLHAGDPVGQSVPAPAIMLALALASWALRPPARRLAGPWV
jgi:uncharacterized membrane protein YphA (DoxX/SURF4 family)